MDSRTGKENYYLGIADAVLRRSTDRKSVV